MKELDINKEYNNGGSLYLEDGYLYKVYNEISYFREEKERNIKFLMNNSIPNTPKIYKMLYKNNEFNGYINFYVGFFDNRDDNYIINKKYVELPSELNSKIDSVEIFDTKTFIDLIDSNVTLEFGNIKDNKIYMKLDINDELIKIEYKEMAKYR